MIARIESKTVVAADQAAALVFASAPLGGGEERTNGKTIIPTAPRIPAA